MLDGTERWIAMAEEKLADTGIRATPAPRTTTCSRSTISSPGPGRRDGRRGPSDPARRVHDGLDGVDEPDALAHVPGGAGTADRGADRDGDRGCVRPETTIFNFHAPPYGSKLDNAPALNDDLTYVSGGQAMRPVSTSVHDAIKRFQPMLSLHGHIHESKGRRGSATLALNPGSSYEEGILQAAVVTIDDKKRKVKNYQLVNG